MQNSRSSKRWAGPIVAVGAALGVTMTAEGTEISRNYDETFPVEEGVILRLEHGDGDVELTTWDKSEIRVQVRYEADFSGIGGADPGFTVDFRHDGNVVRVEGHEEEIHVRSPGHIEIHAHRVKRYEYEVQAPSWIELECRGDDGDVSVRGLTGASIDCRLSDGNIELRDIRTDDVRLRLQDGDLRARGLAARKLEVSSQDGDIDLDVLPVARVDFDITAQDGDVTVRLPRDLSAEYLVVTNDGRVDVDVEASRQEKHEGGAYGVLGDGDGKVRIRTQDGSVRLREASRSS